jgi:hypothetical protein
VGVCLVRCAACACEGGKPVTDREGEGESQEERACVGPSEEDGRATRGQKETKQAHTPKIEYERWALTLSNRRVSTARPKWFNRTRGAFVTHKPESMS